MSGSAKPHAIPAKRILVVDDIVDAAESLRSALSLFGHDVEISGCAKDALSRVSVSRFDLVITDYAMPGMNGIELAHAIRRQAGSPLILLLSAFTFSLAASHEQPLPVDFVLNKPVSIHEMEAALTRLFAASR